MTALAKLRRSCRQAHRRPHGLGVLDRVITTWPVYRTARASTRLTVTGNNVTLSGYDFSLNGGWQVDASGDRDTIENSNFMVGANELVPIVAGASSTNLSVLHNTIDGSGDRASPHLSVTPVLG